MMLFLFGYSKFTSYCEWEHEIVCVISSSSRYLETYLLLLAMSESMSLRVSSDPAEETSRLTSYY